jgi:dephospho-CoA kinase
MRIIGLVGLPGSGKSEAAAVASEHDIPVVTMGDVIREECRDRGLDPASDHGTVAKALREENGPGAIAERSLPVIEEKLEANETVVVDGIRSGFEVAQFREAFGDGFLLVSIEAPFETRAERLDLRGRDADASDGGESLEDRDARELDFGMGKAIEQADLTVENTHSLELFREQIREILLESEAENA